MIFAVTSVSAFRRWALVRRGLHRWIRAGSGGPNGAGRIGREAHLGAHGVQTWSAEQEGDMIRKRGWIPRVTRLPYRCATCR